MKYRKNIPMTQPLMRETFMHEGWKTIKEPANLHQAIMVAMPLMGLNSLLFLGMVYVIDPSLQTLLHQQVGFQLTIAIDLRMLGILMMLFIYMGVHELIHACMIPHFFTSDQCCWGFKGGVAFVYTSEPIKKERYLLISIMPLLLLSLVVPLLFASLGRLTPLIIILGLVNAAGSCVDCLQLLLVLWQVPTGAYVIQNGTETYYKVEPKK